MALVIRCYFHPYFWPFLTQLHHFPYHPFPLLCSPFLVSFSLCFIMLTNRWQEHIWLVTPATRFTAISSYGVLIRMPSLPEKTLGRDTVLAGTHHKRDKASSLGPINVKVDAQKHNPFCKAASQNSTIVKAVHPQLSALPNGEHWKYAFDGPFPIW